jgi:hypothetical protein
MSTDLEQMLRRVLVAFNEHDLDAIRSPFAEDCVFETPRGLSGTTVDGERIDVRGCDLWAFAAEGKIVRKDSFCERSDKRDHAP